MLPKAIYSCIEISPPNPVSGERTQIWICVHCFVKLWQLSLVCLRLRLSFVGSPPVVEVMDHFRLIQWQILRLVLAEGVPLQPPAIRFQLLPYAEEVGVACHIEESLLECNAPWIFFRPTFLHLSNEHWYPVIDGLSQFSVVARAEDGARAGIGVQECDVFN